MSTKSQKTDDEYFNTKDPRSGFRYRIPMLREDTYEYFEEYVDYMKLRENNPALFEKIMNWD